jgi:serine phosphatase RsbU (regulator of sigma subunit)/pSer/pThr/pTyr-binding forkhead associated (FHA) protein
MATLILLQGQTPGRRYSCDGETTIIGRQGECAVCLDDPAVSRKHAKLIRRGDGYYIEDLGSSNGTYINGIRVEGSQLLTETDTLQIGPYVLALRLAPEIEPQQTDPVVRSQVPALSSNSSLFLSNATHKLKVVVEIAQNLGRTLEVQPLLEKLLEQLFRLFPQAERGLVILCEGDHYKIGAQRQRHQQPSGIGSPPQESGDFPFSRSLVRLALQEGAGLLSEDVKEDTNLPKTATMVGLNLRSFLCVPIIGLDQRRLGVLQLECVRPGLAFNVEDLELLTAICLQVASVLDNAHLHEQRLREERLHQELALAREIQQSFLPREFRPLDAPGYELFARCSPAREMSGDLYDFFALPDGKLALFVGDVSGKGMPSALFMIAVRTLVRHLSALAHSPAQLMASLNNALVADNPTSLFVTMVHATFDSRTGETIIVSGGHPEPLLRHTTGRVETIQVRPAMMLGYARFDWSPHETRLVLKPGELLAFYTDGLTEAFTPGRHAMFGVERLQEVLGREGAHLLPQCADVVYASLAEFIRQPEQQDDQTLLLLRRT